jgi:hypothetical protein
MALMEPSAVPKPLTLHLASVLRLTDDQLFELCQRNPGFELELERIWEPGW